MDLQFQNIAKYPFILLVGFIITYLLTPMIMRLARTMGIVDMPDSRRLHTTPTPRCGGLAVFIGFHAGCAAIFFLPWLPFYGTLSFKWWLHFLITSGILLGLGLLDDAFDIRPAVKLAGQIAVALLAFNFDMRVGKVMGMILPMPIDIVITVIWFIVIINAFNLIDGIDGLATGLGAIAAIGIAGSFVLRKMPGDTLVLFSFVGACAAFLRYNFHPAKVFLGDSGSMFIGFTLAAVAIGTSSKGTATAAIGVPLLAVGIPLFDTILAVWRRTVRQISPQDGKKDNGDVFHADMDHIHHRLIRSGLSYRAVASWLYAAGFILVAIGLLSMIFRSRAIGIYLVAFVTALYVIFKHLARVELKDSGNMIIDGLKRPPSRVLAVVLYPPLDAMFLIAAFTLTLLLEHNSLTIGEFKNLWIEQISAWVGLPFISLFFGRTYSRVWSKARISEYVQLMIILTGSILLTAGIFAIVYPYYYLHEIILRVVLYVGIAAPLIVGLRTLPRTVQDIMTWQYRHSIAQHHQTENTPEAPKPLNTLVYGTSHDCTLFLREQTYFTGDQRQKKRHIVGILDNDANLHDRLVHGYRVLGGTQHIDDITKKTRVDDIIITSISDPKVLEELVQIAKNKKLNLFEWKTQLTPTILHREDSSVERNVSSDDSY